MNYRASTKKLQRQLSDSQLQSRTFGKAVAKRISARIDEIQAAATLDDISRFPPARLHRLKGDKDGLFSVDVSANYRLIFAGFDDRSQQTIQVAAITTVVFISVEDYH